MTANSANTAPDVAAILAPLLARLPRQHQPLLLSIAERLAAKRYRAWADHHALRGHAADLIACAAREEEIAARIEGLYVDAAALVEAIRADIPDLDEINRSIFADRPLAQQLAIQAAGERLGAATWRAFARDAGEAESRVFHACAELEEASAEVLESLATDRHK